MTYCCGMRLKDGLVMMADTRTNAGIDNLATYRKLRVLGEPGRSLIVVASAGSLATTQIAIERAIEGFAPPGGRKVESLADAPRIHRAAFLLAQSVRITAAEWRGVTEPGLALDASLLVGGCVAGEQTRLFLIYGAGNFIECCPDTPYLQIGERKFGQPILDRALKYETDLYEAVKIGLLSYISTIQSNHAVDLPIDLAVARGGQTDPELTYRILATDPYYRELRRTWGEALLQTVADLPVPTYRAEPRVGSQPALPMGTAEDVSRAPAQA